MGDRPEDAAPAVASRSPAPASGNAGASQFWPRELLRIGGVALLGVAAGALAGDVATGVAALLLSYLVVHLHRLIRLRLWVLRPKSVELPDVGGLWGEVFDGLHDLQRKNRKKKKKLAAMLSEFQASTAALPDGAVVLGERGEISWFNSAARSMLGLRAHQDSGIRVTNLIRHPAFTEYFDRGDFGREVEAPSPVNHTKTLSLRVIPYGRQQKLLIVRDVSERQMLDAARRDFVSNASHELRTPLTVLRGYLDMMDLESQGAGELASWRQPIAEMRNQALRMESLVNDMLKLARLEARRVQTRDDVLEASSMIRRAVEDARQLSKGQHRFEVEIAGNVRLSGAEAELQSVVGNLLSNAVRYTPPGGVIRLSWTCGPEGARLTVADSGIGIAQEDIPRLTERFYRVDVGRSRASGGTGLGLSIVKHALEGFDSALEIQSELGVGSTFSCLFPPHRIVRSEPPPSPAVEAISRSAP